MKLHLVDGTFELFRAFYGSPAARSPAGAEVGATRGLLRNLLSLLNEDEVTHVGIAFDSVIESFRNGLFAGYKTGEGIEPALLAQFPLAERAARALGFPVWSMVDFEADDAIATAVVRWQDRAGLRQIVICSPDKDFGQCVRGASVVVWDRIRGQIYDETGITTKFGVGPGSIPDWLALVGDPADGIPGVPRWGAKSAAAVLSHYQKLEAIPEDSAQWQLKVRGALALADSLQAHRSAALLYRQLATLRTDVPLVESWDELAWQGAHRAELTAICAEIAYPSFLASVPRWRS